MTATSTDDEVYLVVVQEADRERRSLMCGMPAPSPRLFCPKSVGTRATLPIRVRDDDRTLNDSTFLRSCRYRCYPSSSPSLGRWHGFSTAGRMGSPFRVAFNREQGRSVSFGQGRSLAVRAASRDRLGRLTCPHCRLHPSCPDG